MTIRKKSTILSNINTDLADNNAGSELEFNAEI